jgi:hypothetical protein
MIDFPASPTNGQVFSATNGVVYVYSTAYSSWLAQNPAPPIGGTGDFLATITGVSVGTAVTTPTPLVVQSGNSGGWFVPATGRWTPPAGRYFIWAGMTCAPTGASNCYVFLRKNGTAFISGNTTVTTAAFWGEPTAQYTVDANGTDWFDCQVQSANFATGASSTIWFGASPLTGMQGPTGPLPAGALSLYNEVVLAAPATTMAVTIPANAKAIEIWFMATNVANAVDATGLLLNDMQGASVNVGANHYGQTLVGTGAAASAAAFNGQNAWNMGGAQRLFVGVMRVVIGTDLLNVINADYTCFNASNVANKIQSCLYVGIAGTTGFRLANGGGTQFAAGSYMRVFAVV